MSPLAFFRRQSLRVRITLSFMVAAALLTAVLSLVTYFAVRTVLENSRVSSSTRQSVFALLFAREFLTGQPGRPQELVSLLQSRENFDAMVIEPEGWFATAISLTPDSVPGNLRVLVSQERFGYQYTQLARGRTLVFGGPLPPPGTDLYLFYSLESIDRTLGLLGRVLGIVGLGVLAVAILLAQRVSRRILRPLAGVSDAARRVAEGLLETRVEASSGDELGTLATSFNQMASALQDMLARERRFVAAVSHELRTPLAALRATSEMLASRRHELPPAAAEAADLILEDVADLRLLVEELMEVSELESQRASVRWEMVDLHRLASTVLRRRRRSETVEGTVVTTYADKARVERIVGNLVDNAVEHADGAGLSVTLGSDNGFCKLAVADTGPGIPPEDLPHLFERFYKADRSRSRDHGGIGLGLAIAAQNARLLGGTISAESRPGQGSTFTLRLPLREEPPGDEHPPN
jgi:two-component system, OmpR family, sensor histidine kinase MtrB